MPRPEAEGLHELVEVTQVSTPTSRLVDLADQGRCIVVNLVMGAFAYTTLARAQGARPDAAPLRPEPRRPVRPAAADRRPRQARPQGGVLPRAPRTSCRTSPRPCVACFTALLAFSVIPFGPGWTVGGYYISGAIVNVPISLILIFALGSIGIYGFIVGGWASRVEVLDPRLDAHLRAARLVRGRARALACSAS